MLKNVARLQESSDESTEANKAAGSNLDVGSSTLGVLGAGSAGAWATRWARTRARCARAGRSSAGSRSSGSRGHDLNGGGVVGADNDGAGLVEGGAGAGESEGVDTRADSGDVSGGGLGGDDGGLRGHDCRLAGLLSDNGGLRGLLGGNGEHASDHAEGVGLLEQRGLGEGVDRGLRFVS